jgi:hypothetical protein
MLTGEAREADPVCHLSPHHHVIEAILAEARDAGEPRPYAYRRVRPSPARRGEGQDKQRKDEQRDDQRLDISAE